MGAVPSAASQPPLGAPVVPGVAGSPCALSLPGPFGHNAARIKRYDHQSNISKLTRRPSRALDSPRALLSELQRYKDTVRCATLGVEVPGHRQQQLTQTLIVRLLKTHLFTPILDFEKSTE